VFQIKRGQAALEFLMTYGWAILIVLITVAALAYYGVLRPDKYLPSTCILEVGLNCVGFNVETTKTTLVVQNSFGGTITIEQVAVSKKDGSSCSNIESTTLGNNEKATFILLDCDNGDSREQFEGEINITFTKKESTLTHITKGRMVARIEAGADDQGEDENGGEGNITCSIDSDCGTSGFVGDYYCDNNSITQNQTNYSCLNPGTVDSSCSVRINSSSFFCYNIKRSFFYVSCIKA